LKRRISRRDADEKDFQRRLRTIQRLVPGTSYQDAFNAFILQVLILRIDQMVFRKTPIHAVLRKNPGRFETAQFYPSTPKQKARYSISARKLTHGLENLSMLFCRLFRKNGERRKKRPGANLDDGVWSTAVHEVRHRAQHEGGRTFRLFTGRSGALVQDPLLRAIIQYVGWVARKVARHKHGSGFTKWLNRPHEQDAIIIEMYALHVWDRKSPEELRRIIRLQAPEPK
jgi:hypothetical protein